MPGSAGKAPAASALELRVAALAGAGAEGAVVARPRDATARLRAASASVTRGFEAGVLHALRVAMCSSCNGARCLRYSRDALFSPNSRHRFAARHCPTPCKRM